MKKFLAALALVALALAALVLRTARPAEPAIRVDPPKPPPLRTVPAQLVVYVAGHVVKPGLYRLADGKRVDDAVRAAGGMLHDADPVAVNLAERLEDGEEIVVPSSEAERAAPGRRVRGDRAHGHRRSRHSHRRRISSERGAVGLPSDEPPPR